MNIIEQPLKIERQAQIRRLAKEKRQVTVTELSSVFGVSEATIRRDCLARGDNSSQFF